MKRRFLRPPLVPALALLVLLLAALLARWVAPHDPQQQSLLARLTPPVWLGGGTWRYPLGTDSLGRDVLSNVIYGLRTSFLAGFLSVAISVALGATTGLFAGYRSGNWFETIALRAADVQLSLPAVLIALAVLAVFGRGLEKVIVVIGLVGWAQYARLVRSSVLTERQREYVAAADVMGCSTARVVLRHILPNVVGPILVQISVDVPRAVELAATLSFLGMGVSVTTPDLGIRIAQGYQFLFSGAWWPSVIPGLALVALVLSVNLLGDWVRDVVDPRLGVVQRRRRLA